MNITFTLATVALAGCALASCAAPKLAWHAPDSCLTCEAYDSPVTTSQAPHCTETVLACGGWTMRRFEWHLFNAALSEAVNVGLQHVLGVQARVAATTSALALGFGPHVLHHALAPGDSIDAADWIADGWIRSLPVATRYRWRGIAVYLAGYALVSRYASP